MIVCGHIRQEVWIEGGGGKETYTTVPVAVEFEDALAGLLGTGGNLGGAGKPGRDSGHPQRVRTEREMESRRRTAATTTSGTERLHVMESGVTDADSESDWARTGLKSTTGSGNCSS